MRRPRERPCGNCGGRLVEELSPGDVIATGTPAGIGHREDPPRYLTEGDELSVTLSVGDTELLSLCNRVETDHSGPR